MQYPLVKTKTKDGIHNYGLFLPVDSADTVYIHIHGTGGNFYNEDFMQPLAERMNAGGISFLSTNNRGSEVYDIYERKGAAVEIFEDCILDVDAWIEFALDKGYQKIILSGHSLGAEKIIYYLNKGGYKERVSGIILLSPSNSRGWRLYDKQYQFSVEGKEHVEMLLEEAQTRIKEGRQDELMDVNIRTGFMPRTPASLINILGENSELANVLPFHSGKLTMFAGINVPICLILSKEEEYTGIPPKEAVELMKKENNRTEAHYLETTDHLFTGSEKEVAEIVFDFVSKINTAIYQ